MIYCLSFFLSFTKSGADPLFFLVKDIAGYVCNNQTSEPPAPSTDLRPFFLLCFVSTHSGATPSEMRKGILDAEF